MFNPFKKKDNEFKLDDYELPSLNAQPQNTTYNPENPFESTPKIDQNSFDMPNTESPLSQLPEQNSFSQPNNFGNPFANPEQNNQISQQVEQKKDNNEDNIQKDITKAKLETMDSKMTLIDAKLASIDLKLEILTKMIHAEVSEDTKRKLSVQSMMSNIKE